MSTIEFRPYQPPAIDFVSRRRKAIVKAPAGSGKTIIAAGAIFKVYSAKPRPIPPRIGWIANTLEQVQQARAALDRFPMVLDAVVACAQGQPDMSDRELLVVDECFPAGTVINGRVIEDIAVGEMVECMDHARGFVVYRSVTRIFRSVPTSMARVWMADHTYIDCTPGHPFWNGTEYVPAARLTSGSVVLTITRHETCDRKMQEMRAVSGLLRKGSTAIPEVKLSNQQCGLLLGSVQGGVGSRELVEANGDYQLEARLSAYEGEEPNAKPGNASGRSNETEGHAVEADHPGWERTRANGGGVDLGLRARMGDERDCSHQLEAATASTSLQGGRGEPGIKDRDRDRRKEPLPTGATSAGSKEGRASHFIRVDRVEVLKPTGDGTFGGVCSDGFVYNIEVEDHHNYFANGILVHNCHHALAPLWRAIIDNCPGCLWGFTATPFPPEDPRRGELVSLFGGEMYEVSRESIGENLAAGRVVMLDASDGGLRGRIDETIEENLSKMVERCYFAMGSKVWEKHWREFGQIHNFSARTSEAAMEHARSAGLSAKAKTFVNSKLKDELWPRVASRACIDLGIATNLERNAAVVRVARRHEADHVLIMVNSKEHGYTLANELPGAVVAHSKMGAKKRKAAIEDIRAGRLHWLIATSLADEGLDVQRANVLILAAGGRSARAVEQRSGRVMRSFDGKTEGVVYDFLDTFHPLTKKHALARIATYRSLGYEIQLPQKELPLLA